MPPYRPIECNVDQVSKNVQLYAKDLNVGEEFTVPTTFRLEAVSGTKRPYQLRFVNFKGNVTDFCVTEEELNKLLQRR